MTSSRPTSSGNEPPSRRSARQQRLANRQANRSPAQTRTHGSPGKKFGSVLIWSLAAVVVGVVAIGAALILSSPKSLGGSGQLLAPSAITPLAIPSDGRTLGNASAPVTIDIYGDFRCSACLYFTTGGTEKSLVDNYIATGKAKLVWHDFLTIDKAKHETASRDAANAAWCAADQGKFWTMHDWLYANQSPTEDASAFTQAKLAAIGQAAGLDMSRFQPCLDGGTHNADVATEDASTPPEVGGTPSVSVNGAFVGDQGKVPTYPQIQAAIEVALGSSVPSASPGTSP
jgi:protein-disulfide isomerase